ATATRAISEGSQLRRMLTPGECSAWLIRSDATYRGSAEASAISTTSLGPAIMSISTSPYTCFLASATKRLPGPTILSTAGTPSTPYASAATACAPPMRYTSVTPRAWQAASRSVLYPPNRVGGATTAISATPAACAGTTVIRSVEG